MAQPEQTQMAHNHEFDCPICGAHLDSRDDLTRHTDREHAQHGRGPSDPERGRAGGRTPSGDGIPSSDRDTRLD